MANTAVRNTGTIAGNLMLKHAHQYFPSDLFLMLETIGANIVVASALGVKVRNMKMDFNTGGTWSRVRQ